VTLKTAEKPSRQYNEYHYTLIKQVSHSLVEHRHDARKAFTPLMATPKHDIPLHKNDIVKQTVIKIKNICKRKEYPFNQREFYSLICNPKGSVTMPGPCCPKLHTLFRRIEEMATNADVLQFAEPKRRGLYHLNPTLFGEAET